MTVLTITYSGRDYDGMTFEDCFRATMMDDIANGLAAGVQDEDGNTELQRKCRGAMLDLEGIANRLAELHFMEPGKADKHYRIAITDIRATDHYTNE